MDEERSAITDTGVKGIRRAEIGTKILDAAIRTATTCSNR
jgi:hypothetical protein